MCGISGIVYKKPTPQNSTHKEMLQTLKRRGPNQEGIVTLGKAVLIHARLSVVDLEHGRQPMTITHKGKTYTLVYNGELYNTQELRDELKLLGHTFISHSDTEVLLHAYIEFGEACVQKFNGIFAFAVYCKETDTLFFARDRIGVKPFFYALVNNEFIFGSEIKAILKSGKIKPAIGERGVAELILVAPGRTQGFGVFEGIEELKPAHFGYFKKEQVTVHRYWQMTHVPHTDSFKDTVINVRDLVTDSIKRQLVSDVKVGTFLSGGLDSSIISSIASKTLNTPLDTFSVDYKDNSKYFKASHFQPNSDSNFIDTMNNYVGGVSHKIILDSSELVDALYDATIARDLPGMADVDSSLLLFCKSIKNDVTVALSGECADEIFGGYPWYRDKDVRNIPGFPWAKSTAVRETFFSDKFKHINGRRYVDELYQQTLKDTHILAGTSEDEKRIKQMTNLNFTWFMQTLLDRKDRMSMYSGLEVRVPFCDYRIADYLYSVPFEMKDYEGREKGLLRESVKDYLPDEILHRKKSPYPKTHNPEYLKLVKVKLSKILQEKDNRLFEMVNKQALEKLLVTDDLKFYGQLMNVPQTIAYFIQLDFWLKHYDVSVK